MQIKLLKLIGLTIFLSAGIAHTESVFVDVKGEVSLEGFNCGKTNSVLIKKACYKPEESYLLVQIKDNWFQHCAIDQKMYDSLISAKSFNRFYNEDIKGKFSCYH
jgi:hypothetical protein